MRVRDFRIGNIYELDVRNDIRDRIQLSHSTIGFGIRLPDCSLVAHLAL